MAWHSVFPQSMDLKRPPVVKVPSAARYSVTHYHLPDAAVDCEVNTDQVGKQDVVSVLF